MARINYDDLHKLYKREFSENSLPVQKAAKSVTKVVRQPVAVRVEPTAEDGPVRDLVRTVAGYAVGWGLSGWLVGERKTYSSDPNQLWSDVR